MMAAPERPTGPAMEHIPVMLPEVLEALALRPGAVVLDATLGLAGHSLAFAARIAPGGTLVAFDWDEEMLAVARERLAEVTGVTAHLFREAFFGLGDRLEELDLRLDGALFDLGLNRAQIADATRGLSFRDDGPLDMRMDRQGGEPASALLNRLPPQAIEQILFDLGDERWARAIAKQIVERRKVHPLRTTQDLVDAVLAAIPPGARDKRIHPATRTFQAVRIAVTGELEGIEGALRDAAARLNPGGAIAVLSYHSGEDRIVKNTFRDLAEEGFAEAFRKPKSPSDEEIQRNPSSRSAKLRVLRRPFQDPDRP